MVIAKESGDSIFFGLHSPWPIQLPGVGGKSCAVAEKSKLQCAPQNAFVRAKPLEPFFGCDGQRLIGDRAFGGPQSSRLNAENTFVIFARAAQLFSCVF